MDWMDEITLYGIHGLVTFIRNEAELDIFCRLYPYATLCVRLFYFFRDSSSY